MSAAREQVRTAQALRRLPKLSAALENGELSYTKVRALTRVATEQDEELLLAYARRASAQDVEDRVRQMRNTAPESAEEARRAWERRSLTVLRKPNRGTLLISIEVPEAEGEIIVRAIERAVASGDVAVGADHFGAHGEDRSATDGWRAQQADAMVAVAKAYLARRGGRKAAGNDDSAAVDGDAAPSGTSVADHYQVVVHVDEKALRGAPWRDRTGRMRYVKRRRFTSSATVRAREPGRTATFSVPVPTVAAR